LDNSPASVVIDYIDKTRYSLVVVVVVAAAAAVEQTWPVVVGVVGDGDDGDDDADASQITINNKDRFRKRLSYDDHTGDCVYGNMSIAEYDYDVYLKLMMIMSLI
jgi:hypothetical protein